MFVLVATSGCQGCKLRNRLGLRKLRHFNIINPFHHQKYIINDDCGNHIQNSKFEKFEKFDLTDQLHNYVKKGDLRTVKHLVENRQINIDAKDNQGMTPLHRATTFKKDIHSDIVNYLIKKGADVNTVDANQNTPLHSVVRFSNNHKTLRILLRNGANPNVFNNKGFGPLNYAIEHNKIKTVKILIENEANFETENWHNNFTPLKQAITKENKQIVDFLIKRGAKCTIQDMLQTYDLFWKQKRSNYIDRFILKLLRSGDEKMNFYSAEINTQDEKEQQSEPEKVDQNVNDNESQLEQEIKMIIKFIESFSTDNKNEGGGLETESDDGVVEVEE